MAASSFKRRRGVAGVAAGLGGAGSRGTCEARGGVDVEPSVVDESSRKTKQTLEKTPKDKCRKIFGGQQKFMHQQTRNETFFSSPTLVFVGYIHQ